MTEQCEAAYLLYIVTNCSVTPRLQEPVKDPARFPWHEVNKVAHYWLEVDALSACDAQAGLTRPMMVKEEQSTYGGRKE